jgi:transcriptional regulator with XRE-family HTH domain
MKHDNIPKTVKYLPETIAKLRQIFGYSQKILYSELKVCQSTYSDFETGHITPSDALLLKIATFYGLTLQAFFILAETDPDINFEALINVFLGFHKR